MLLSERMERQTLRVDEAKEVCTLSTYLFHFVHCHQPLHTCLLEDPDAFYVTFPQYLYYCVFKVNLALLLSYRSLFHHEYFFAILLSVIRSTCPNRLSTFFFIITVTSSLLADILCISSLPIR